MADVYVGDWKYQQAQRRKAEIDAAMEKLHTLFWLALLFWMGVFFVEVFTEILFSPPIDSILVILRWALVVVQGGLVIKSFCLLRERKRLVALLDGAKRSNGLAVQMVEDAEGVFHYPQK